MDPDDEEECNVLARNWFNEPEAKREVARLLADIQLDEAAIVAQATRALYNDLHQLD